MANTIEQAGKAPTQVYRTKEENQPAFRPRYDVQEQKTADATKDIESLLGSKAGIVRQEHAVSVGIAKRMANDHVMSLNEEIKFLDSQLGETDNRALAQKRLQQAIANTSGVSAGLTGDAAQAYDELYIKTARGMATSAISKWDQQQDSIDKNTLKTEFKTFMENTYSDLDPESQSIHLAVWGERFSSYGDVSFGDIEKIGVDNLTKKFMSSVKADPEGNPFDYANKTYSQYAQIEPDGTIKFKTENTIVQKSISDAVYSATQPRLKMIAAQKLKEMNEAYSESNKVTVAKVAAMNSELDAYVSRYGIDMETLGGEELKKYEAEKARLIEKYDINTAINASDEAIYNKVVGLESGGSYTAKNPKSTAYGKYQFTEARAKDMWRAAGLRGKMVHGKQTPEQQEAMWGAQKKQISSWLTRNGKEVTPGNFYVVHQLGEGGAARYFSGTLNQQDIKDMNVNIGNKYKSPELHRAEVIQAWRVKHLSGELTEAQAIKTQSLLDVAEGEVEYRTRVGERKDAAADLETAQKLQTKVNEGVKAGTLSKDQQTSIEDKIDKLLLNNDIPLRDRKQFYDIQGNTEGIINDYHDSKDEQDLLNRTMETTARLIQEDPTKDYQVAYKEALVKESGDENYSFKFLTNQMDAISKNHTQETKRSIELNQEMRTAFIESPLAAIENNKIVTDDMIAQLEPYYDQMSKVEQLRYDRATSAYFKSQNFIRDTYKKTSYTGELPEVGQIDPLTGLSMNDKTRKEVMSLKKQKFNLALQSVFQTGTATPGEKLEMTKAMNSGKDGIDSEVLAAVAKEKADIMVTSPAAFAREYGKYPQLFAQPRFRVALINQLPDDKEKGTWYAYEAMSKQAVIMENQKAADEGREPNYTQMPATIMDAPQAALLQSSSAGMITEESLKTMKDTGMPVSNYENMRESVDDMNVHPADREVYMKVANKMVRAGLDHMIPSVASNMGFNYLDVADGIKGHATRRIQQFFERNPKTRDKPWKFVQEALKTKDGTMTMPQAKELIDEGRISIVENGPLNRIELIYTKETGEKVTIPFDDKFSADEMLVGFKAPGMRR